jgi:hypothetical protein
MADLDLFGHPVQRSGARTDAERKRERRREYERPKGYAALPGTGPTGEFCRTCKHACFHERAKRYWKCDLIKRTHGPGTDIRLKSPACRRWEQREGGGPKRRKSATVVPINIGKVARDG